MRPLFLLFPALLAGCDSTSAPQNATAPAVAATPSGPAFAVTVDQATTLVESLGVPWAGATRKDGLRDSKTGGTVRTLTSADGSAQIFTWPAGQVWQVRLIAGGAGGCGDIAQLRAALPKLASGLSLTPTPAERQKISDNLNDPGTRYTAVTGAKVQVVGGCRMWLTMTAA